MKCYIGIDLGSTTTKAVLMDEDDNVLGRGITNSRSNYDTASTVAKQEAIIDTRLTLLRRNLAGLSALEGGLDDVLGVLERSFRHQQFLEQLGDLRETCRAQLDAERFADTRRTLEAVLEALFGRIEEESAALFAPGAARKSDFFRDIAGSRYMTIGEELAKEAELGFDLLLNLYDKAIIEVENRPPDGNLKETFLRGLESAGRKEDLAD